MSGNSSQRHENRERKRIRIRKRWQKNDTGEKENERETADLYGGALPSRASFTLSFNKLYYSTRATDRGLG